MRAAVSLCALQLMFAVSVSEANYEFTVRFYEFRNPLGLQCGACESGGHPACCDDVNRTENCINENTGPLRCDTRFRFTLRPYEASVETAPDTDFPHFNGGNFIPNNITFTEGPEGFKNLQNPYTITNASKWTGRVQFFIDALDRVVPHRTAYETEAIINRFPIDLELELGANFTERTTYTGIYNISGLGFDMSFRVQCSENYYGPDCTIFCEPMEGMYICDSEGRAICVQNPATNCTMCFPQFTGEKCSTKSSGGGESDALVAGAVGGTSVIFIIVLLILCVLIVIVMKVKQKGKHHSTTVNEGMHDELLTSQQVLPPQMKTVTMDADKHDLNNYAEAAEDPVTDVKNGNLMSPSTGLGNGIIDPVRYEYPQDGILDVPSHCPDGKFSGEADQVNVLSSYSQNSHNQQARKNTFPYMMENAPQASDSVTNTSPQYQNVHGSHTTMNKPGTDSITMTSGLPTSEHNDHEYEYDVLEQCNTASPAVPRSVANPDGSLVHSLATEPMEGEVYNVAYPVLTPKAESRVVVDAAYECLSNIY